MLSKRSLALTSVAYNLAAILTNLLVDILAPGPFVQCLKKFDIIQTDFLILRQTVKNSKPRWVKRQLSCQLEFL